MLSTGEAGVAGSARLRCSPEPPWGELRGASANLQRAASTMLASRKQVMSRGSATMATDKAWQSFHPIINSVLIILYLRGDAFMMKGRQLG